MKGATYSRIAFGALAAVTLLSGVARAYTIGDITVSEWAYVGGATAADDLAIMVIDFNLSSRSSEYAFGVYFVDDNTVTGMDLLNGLDSDTGLVLNESGGFVNGISYAGHDGNYTYPPYWSYWLSGDGETWSWSQIGAGDRIVHDGAWDGWSTAYDYPPEAPPGVPGVPEPMTVTLLVLGGVGALRRHCRR